MSILVTGSAGFIGRSLVNYLLRTEISTRIIGLDVKSPEALSRLQLPLAPSNASYQEYSIDLKDRSSTTSLLDQIRPRVIFHLAAETHVDISIAYPQKFIQENTFATFELLEASRIYWQQCSKAEQQAFRFFYISTDEIYGALSKEQPPVLEHAPIRPSNPYAASKAAAGAFVHAWSHTYGIPCLHTLSTNNYGPGQSLDKLIPKTIWLALQGKPIPVYGNGLQQRDWIFVEDHCSALHTLLQQGAPRKQVYHISAHHECRNLDIMHQVLHSLDQLHPRAQGSYVEQLQFVEDRPGHDQRYALDASELHHAFSWQAQKEFDLGLQETVAWFVRCWNHKSHPSDQALRTNNIEPLPWRAS